jgi:hypothetical protein
MENTIGEEAADAARRFLHGARQNLHCAVSRGQEGAALLR